MTQYLLSVWHSPNNPVPTDPEVMQQSFDQTDAVNNELQAAGVWVFAGGLHEPSSATVVSATDGDPVMTDGPFAESKEQLGGFWILELPDLDAALAWAVKCSTACMSPVEVRPFQNEPPTV
jgi:hypothetical protein